VHLQRLDQKVPVVATIGTSQRHVALPFEIDSMRWLRLTQCKYGRNLLDFSAHAHDSV
jgi:hypothetical protein